jgi:hypothetical protein
MFLKRNIIDVLVDEGVSQFILIGENVLNFHTSDDSYYEEWFEDIEEGWIAFINFHEHVLSDFAEANIDYYITSGGKLNDLNWRTYLPPQLYEKVEKMVMKRIG